MSGSQEREVKFAKTLEELRRRAREQGNMLTREEVVSAFSELSLGEEQLEPVFDYLKKHNVGIGEPADVQESLTGDERDYLQDYLGELERLEKVSPGEKEAITIQAMAGEAAAQRRLAEIYLPDVVEIAKLYAGQGVLLEDLIGEGNVALSVGTTMLGCLDEAGQAQGMLGKMIMDAMEDLIGESYDSAKTEQKVLDKVNRVADKARELAQDLGRKVTPQELAQESGLTQRSILEAYRLSGSRIEDLDVPKDA